MERSAKLTVVARTVHEAIRAYQAGTGGRAAPPWETSGWMQASTLEAVEFALADPTPGAQHAAWCASKRRDGWRYGPVKDESEKTHPSLVPFEDLSESEKRKDALLIAVVQAVAAVLELRRP